MSVACAVRVESAEQMEQLGVRLAQHLRNGDLVVLDGPLGAGKTTLSRGLGAGLGVRGDVTSPTFVIARRHRAGPLGTGLLHVDAYRLSAIELDDLELDDEAAECVTVVEWGRGKVDAWSADRLLVEVLLLGDDPSGPREVRICGHGGRWENVDVLLQDAT
jgi:tRNA threonylcarbamoyladenosine biosynthesis protein TsaE